MSLCQPALGGKNGGFVALVTSFALEGDRCPQIEEQWHHRRIVGIICGPKGRQYWKGGGDEMEACTDKLAVNAIPKGVCSVENMME